MRSLHLFCTVVTGLSLCGCASTPQPVITSNETAGQRWTGSFQPTQQRSGQAVATGQNRVFGSVQLRTAEGTTLRRMHVALTIAASTEASGSLRWAVLPERCGSGGLPLLSYEQFPYIEMGANGRGQSEVDLPLELAPNSAYHVNVYKGGQQLDNVITCANLKFEAGAR